jgi:predicted porin
MYGVADLGIARYRTSDATKTAMHPAGSGSRIGFLASEDLGQGVQVNVRIEAGVNLDTGSSSSTNGNPNRVWSRQAYVELASRELGAIRVGRQEGPTYSFFPMFDPMLMPSMDSWGVLSTLGAPTPGTATGTGRSNGFLINPTGRTENTIAYISPRMRGAQAKLAYSVSEGSSTQPNLLEASVDYITGPLMVGALYVNADDTPGTGSVRPTAAISEYAVGAKYQAGPIHPYMTYIRREATDHALDANGQVFNGQAETVKLVGAVIPVSARGHVRLTYGRYDSGTPDSDARSYGVAYTYTFSRTLMAMVAVTHLSQQGASRWPVFQSPVPEPGGSVDGVVIGANWRF